jgi:hypothetical protein
MKIYVASSWRNERQQDVVKTLRAANHEVYDFRERTFEEMLATFREYFPVVHKRCIGKFDLVEKEHGQK